MTTWHHVRNALRRRCDDLVVMCCGVDQDPSARPVTTAMDVSIDRITATMSRCCDFDRCFRPLRDHLRQRLAALRTVFHERHLPAVRLLQVGDDYAVVDGHHRLAIARERGMVAVDAIVTCRC